MTMNKVFIPQVGVAMALVSDSTLSLSPWYGASPAEEKILERKGFVELEKERGQYYVAGRTDVKTGKQIHRQNHNTDIRYDVVFPAGTIFKITKMNIKNRTQPNPVQQTDDLTLQIVYSPDRDINKSGRIAIPVDVINRLDMEWVDIPEKENGR
jgi:hypothetical protein